MESENLFALNPSRKPERKRVPHVPPQIRGLRVSKLQVRNCRRSAGFEENDARDISIRARDVRPKGAAESGSFQLLMTERTILLQLPPLQRHKGVTRSPRKETQPTLNR